MPKRFIEPTDRVVFDIERTPFNVSKYRLLQLTDYKCYYCGYNLTVSSCQKEHFIPRSKGGAGGVKSGNIVPSCFQCNMKKGVKNLEEFRVKLYGKRNIQLFHFEKLLING